MFFHLRNVPLILGSKRPGGFYQIGSETQKNIKKTLRLAYGQCSSKLYLAVVLSPWVHEAHAEDRQGLCPDEIGRVQSIWFVDSICADLWWLSLHTYCPTKEKQQKQVKQKLGTLKTRVVRINVARATLMMQWCYPLELRIMMGDHPLQHGFPPCWIPTRISLNMGSWFMRFYSILFHWMVCSDQDDNYSESDFQHQNRYELMQMPHWKEVTNIPLERELKGGGSLCHIIHSWWNFAISGYCLSSPKDALLVYFPPLIFGNNYRETMAREVRNRTTHNVRLNNWILTNTFQAASLWSLLQWQLPSADRIQDPLNCVRSCHDDMMTWIVWR